MSRKLTIGYLLDDTLDVADGVQQAMIAIAEKMRARGHDVHYLVSNTERKDLKNIHSIGKSWSVKFNGNSVRTPLPTPTKNIKSLLSDVRFDIIHVQMPYSPFFSAKVIKLAPEKTKVFGTFHILPYSILSIYGTKLLARSLRISHKRIYKSYAVSEPARQFMQKSFRLDGTVLPNPVDYKFFHNAKPTRSKNQTNIVFVGRFEERKGVKQLVKAYELLDNKKKLKFVMCGKGPLHEELVRYAKKKKLDIEFPGFVTEKEKAELLAGADIAIFPSISGESFGIVLTEAMSAGAEIVLGGDNPGYESVLHEWPETIFNAKDPKSIAAKLNQFINDKKLRKNIGTKQHKAAQNYDIEKVADALERGYLKLAKNTQKEHN